MHLKNKLIIMLLFIVIASPILQAADTKASKNTTLAKVIKWGGISLTAAAALIAIGVGGYQFLKRPQETKSQVLPFQPQPVSKELLQPPSMPTVQANPPTDQPVPAELSIDNLFDMLDGSLFVAESLEQVDDIVNSLKLANHDFESVVNDKFGQKIINRHKLSIVLNNSHAPLQLQTNLYNATIGDRGLKQYADSQEGTDLIKQRVKITEQNIQHINNILAQLGINDFRVNANDFDQERILTPQTEKQTPLQFAIRYSYVSLLQALLDAGALVVATPEYAWARNDITQAQKIYNDASVSTLKTRAGKIVDMLKEAYKKQQKSLTIPTRSIKYSAPMVAPSLPQVNQPPAKNNELKLRIIANESHNISELEQNLKGAFSDDQDLFKFAQTDQGKYIIDTSKKLVIGNIDKVNAEFQDIGRRYSRQIPQLNEQTINSNEHAFGIYPYTKLRPVTFAILEGYPYLVSALINAGAILLDYETEKSGNWNDLLVSNLAIAIECYLDNKRRHLVKPRREIINILLMHNAPLNQNPSTWMKQDPYLNYIFQLYGYDKYGHKIREIPSPRTFH